MPSFSRPLNARNIQRHLPNPSTPGPGNGSKLLTQRNFTQARDSQHMAALSLPAPRKPRLYAPTDRLQMPAPGNAPPPPLRAPNIFRPLLQRVKEVGKTFGRVYKQRYSRSSTSPEPVRPTAWGPITFRREFDLSSTTTLNPGTQLTANDPFASSRSPWVDAGQKSGMGDPSIKV